MRLQFQYIQGLWLLVAIGIFILLYTLYVIWKKKVTRQMGDPALIRQLTATHSPLRQHLKFVLLLLAFGSGVLALMNLRKPGGDGGGERKGIDVVIALDVSKSMWARDQAPNRLEAAKQMIHALIDQMPGNRIGLVLFAGKAYLQMPLTSDHSAAKLFVSTADPLNIPQPGTVISEAMRTAALAFNNKERKFKSVVLVSDGEDHDPSAAETAREMAEQGIMINTVGIGSMEGATIIDPATGQAKPNAQGQPIQTKLNEEELRNIASTTHGVYIRLENPTVSVNTLVEQLSKVKKEDLSDLSLVNYTSYYLWFGIPMLLLLLIEFFTGDKRSEKRVQPAKKMQPALMLLVLLGLAFPTRAQVSELNQANQRYRQSQYTEAEAVYRRLLSGNPQDEKLRYNQALTQYRLEQKDSALSGFEKIISLSSDPGLRSKASYNAGVVNTSRGRLDQSIESYKQALRLNPMDTLARENLQKALLEKKKRDAQKKEEKKTPRKTPPPPAPPKMNPKQAQQKLKNLQQKEQRTQQRLQQKPQAGGGYERKDW